LGGEEPSKERRFLFAKPFLLRLWPQKKRRINKYRSQYLIDAFFFDAIGPKKKALQKRNAEIRDFALCGARGASAAPARRLLKKAGENFLLALRATRLLKKAGENLFLARFARQIGFF